MSVEQWFKENVHKVAPRCCGACIHAVEYKPEGEVVDFTYCKKAVEETSCLEEEASIETCYVYCACKKFEISPDYAQELKAEDWWNGTWSWYKPSCKICGMSAKMENSDKLYCKFMQEATELSEKYCFVDPDTVCSHYAPKNNRKFNNM